MGNSIDRTVLCGILTQSQGQMAWILMFIPNIRKTQKETVKQWPQNAADSEQIRNQVCRNNSCGWRMLGDAPAFVCTCGKTNIMQTWQEWHVKHENRNYRMYADVDTTGTNRMGLAHLKSEAIAFNKIANCVKWQNSILEIKLETVASATYYYELLHRLHQSIKRAYNHLYSSLNQLQRFSCVQCTVRSSSVAVAIGEAITEAWT